MLKVTERAKGELLRGTIQEPRGEIPTLSDLRQICRKLKVGAKVVPT